MLVIFEMANNHGGDLYLALKMINDFSEVAHDYPQFKFAFKTQYRDIKSYIHSSADISNKYVKRFMETNMPDKDRKRVVAEVKKRGFMAICTPFDEESVWQARNHGYDMLKVGSPSFTDWPLWNCILGEWNSSVIASCGGASEPEIKRVVESCDYTGVPLTLMHCVSEYPTPQENLNLGQLIYLKRYGLPVGFSSHQEPVTCGLSFAAILGATVLERHITVNKANEYSVSPDEIAEELDMVKTAVSYLGESVERVPGAKPTQFMRREIDGRWCWIP